MLVQSHGIQLRWVPLTADGQLDLTNLDELLKGAKIFSFTAMSNVLGTLTPVKQLCAAAHAAGHGLVRHAPAHTTGHAAGGRAGGRQRNRPLRGGFRGGRRAAALPAAVR